MEIKRIMKKMKIFNLITKTAIILMFIFAFNITLNAQDTLKKRLSIECDIAMQQAEILRNEVLFQKICPGIPVLIVPDMQKYKGKWYYDSFPPIDQCVIIKIHEVNCWYIIGWWNGKIWMNYDGEINETIEGWCEIPEE